MTLPRRLLIAFTVAVTIAYYFWTGMITAGGPPRIHGNESDHFNLLSRGFRQGQLHLDTPVPPGLLAAANPYDPALRRTVTVLHDASYYRGKYYIYFGPAPVVTLLLPFNLLTGRDLPLPYAVWLFSSFGYVALAGTLLFLQRRYYPRASVWTVTAGLLAVGWASLVVALLRRASIWEFSAASGFGFFAASLLCLIRAWHSPRHARAWATVGGLVLGLAVASRPTYLLGSALFALPWLWPARGSTAKDGYDWRALLGAAVSCGILVLALLAYNHARFGDALEFGQRYQLTSVIESENRHFSPGYVAFNFRLYFLSALQWIPYFPFVNGIALPPLPPGHGGHEFTFGLLTNLPFSLFGAVLFFGPIGRRAWRELPRPFGLTLGAIAGAAILNATLLLFFFGSCLRYMVDFTPWIMLLAALGVFAGEDWLRTPGTRRVWRGAALGLAVISSCIAAWSVVNFYYSVPGEPAPAYRPVARLFNRPVSWIQHVRWPDYQPQEIELTFPSDRRPRQEPIVTVSRGKKTTAVLFIDYLDDRKIRLGYHESDLTRPVLYSPAFAAPPGGRHTLRVSIGGTYAEYNGLRGRLHIRFDQAGSWEAQIVSFTAYPGKLGIGREAAASSGETSFTGEIHAVRPIAMPATVRPRLEGIRVRLTPKPEMTGHAYPLFTSGWTKAGDMFFFRVHAGGKISFGYDHWGDALLTSPEIAAPPGETRVVEFWVPALAAPGTAPEVLVRVDGATVWRQAAPAYASTPETQFVGSNPIGGSTCEVFVENAVFDELQLAAPAP